MKKLLIVLLVLVLAGIGTATAQNMTVSDMGFAGPQTIQIYSLVNGTAVLAGTYNTTTNGIALPAGDFSLVIKAESTDYLRNPANLLDTGFGFVETNFIAILFIFTIIGSLLWLGRR